MSSDRPFVVLKKGREVSLLRRHPWVFSGAIQSKNGALSNGSPVDVHSHDGRRLGFGHWGTRGIAVRVLSLDAATSEMQVLEGRIEDALALRSELDLIGNRETTGFRLVHGEGDGLPGLVIDLYGDVAVVQCHSPGMWRLRAEIERLLRNQQALAIKRVLVKQLVSAEEDSDVRSDGEAPPAAVEPNGGLVTISENRFRFLVDVDSGQKTGFFIDQRCNRELLARYVKGRQVLNTFSYTGAFSVYALGAGASWVTSVDISKTAVELCRQNVMLNFPGASHTAEVADCFEYLGKTKNTYDVIVVDPPAFAKHQKAVGRGVKGYESINASAFKAVKKGGIIFTFSCSQLVSRELFRDSVLRAASQAGRNVKIIHHLHQSPCHPVNLFHPEGDYLKGLVLFVE